MQVATCAYSWIGFLRIDVFSFTMKSHFPYSCHAYDQFGSLRLICSLLTYLFFLLYLGRGNISSHSSHKEKGDFLATCQSVGWVNAQLRGCDLRSGAGSLFYFLPHAGYGFSGGVFFALHPPCCSWSRSQGPCCVSRQGPGGRRSPTGDPGLHSFFPFSFPSDLRRWRIWVICPATLWIKWINFPFGYHWCMCSSLGLDLQRAGGTRLRVRMLRPHLKLLLAQQCKRKARMWP